MIRHEAHVEPACARPYDFFTRMQAGGPRLEGKVFVKASLEVPITLDRISAEMLRSPRDWLLPLIIENRAHSRLLRAELGADLAPRPGRVRLDVEPPVLFADRTAVPFRVRVEDAERWASFDNVLTASWFGEVRTQLAFECQYEQPTWLTLREQTLLHQVGEASSRHFLGTVAAELTERVHARSSSTADPAP